MEQSMDYTKLISDYLEGFLNETDEASLFGVLASHGDLRSEFGSQLAMQRAMLSDIQNVTVPEDAMKGVFAGLGFTSPVPSVITSTVTAAVVPVSHSFGSLWSALGASVVTAIVMWFLLQQGTNTATTSSSNITQNTLQTVSPITNTGTQAEQTVTAPRQQTREVIRYINTGMTEADIEHIVSERVAAERERLRSEILTEAKPNVAHELNGTVSSIDPRSQKIHSERSYPSLSSMRISPDEYEQSQTQYALYLRSTPSLSFPSVNAIGDNLSVKNYAISGMYIFPGGEHLIGIEAGAENFSQVFTTEVNGLKETYEQNPTFMYGGVSYRFMPHVGFAEYFRPFVHLTAGATHVGPVGKASVGISYQPETMIELLLGWDMSALYYPTSNDWQVSRKAGFTFGAGIKF